MSDSDSDSSTADCAGQFHCLYGTRDFNYDPETDTLDACDRSPCPHRYDDTTSQLGHILADHDTYPLAHPITRPSSARVTPLVVDAPLPTPPQPTQVHNDTASVSPLAEHFDNLDLDPDPLVYELPSSSAPPTEAHNPSSTSEPHTGTGEAPPPAVPPELLTMASIGPQDINGLVQAIHGLVQQMQQNATTPVQAPVSVSTVKLKPKEPEAFAGDKSKYETWKNEMLIYVQGESRNEMIKYVLSYIRGNKAIDSWKRAFREAHHTGTPPQWTFASSSAFWEALDKVFADPNLKRRAYNDLTQLTQGNKSAQDFFVEFEQLLTTAGLTTKDPSAVEMILQKVRRDILKDIYRAKDKPTTYKDWKERIIDLDDADRAFDLLSRHPTSAPRVSLPAPRATTTNTTPPRPAPSRPLYNPHADRKDGTGVTYGGRGQAMEIDRFKAQRCRKPTCGARKDEAGTCGSPWHLPNRPNQRLRAWETDERDELVANVRAWAAEEPEDFIAQGFIFETEQLHLPASQE